MRFPLDSTKDYVQKEMIAEAVKRAPFYVDEQASLATLKSRRDNVKYQTWQMLVKSGGVL
jgi:hypothetical protein